MKIRFFKLDKNKRYNYTPRFYNGKEKGSAYEIGSRIRKDRETLNETIGVQWSEARKESRNRNNREVNVRLVVIVLILLLLALYFLDFDLSIFFQKK